MVSEGTLYVDVETDRLLFNTGYTRTAPLSWRTGAEAWSEYLDAASKLRVTVAVTEQDDCRTVYVTECFTLPAHFEADVNKMGLTLVRGMGPLVEAMRRAPVLCAWNACFDLQVLSSYAADRVQWLRSCCARVRDPMLELAQVTGRYHSLADVAKLTLTDDSEHKSGSGSDAPGLFEREEWTELVRYCAQDVTVLRAVAERETVVVAVDFQASHRPLSACGLKRKYRCTHERGTQTQTLETNRLQYISNHAACPTEPTASGDSADTTSARCDQP